MKTIICLIFLCIIGGCVYPKGDASAIKLQQQVENQQASLLRLESRITGVDGDISAFKESSSIYARDIEELHKQLIQLRVSLDSSNKQIADNDVKLGNLEKSVINVGNQTNDTGGMWVYITVVSLAIIAVIAFVALTTVWLQWTTDKKRLKAVNSAIDDIQSNPEIKSKLMASIKGTLM